MFFQIKITSNNYNNKFSPSMVIKTLFATYLFTNLIALRSNSQMSSSQLLNQQQQQQITISNLKPINFPNITLPASAASGGRTNDSAGRAAEEQQRQQQQQQQQKALWPPTISAASNSNRGSLDLSTDEGKSVASFADSTNGGGGNNRNSTAPNGVKKNSIVKRKNVLQPSKGSSSSSNKTIYDEEQQPDSSESNEMFDDAEENTGLAGTQKEPDCASHGRYYCTYKEDYPLKLVTEVTKYYKWPLEKLFRDLHAQIMPKLAQDSTGNLVCDSVTRVVRPGWARNTNDRWLVVINTDNYHQYVTEVVCQYGSNSRCNFIPPCYYSSCQQRYNTQKLLVIDPANPYRGPFLSEFLFPSCCVCYVPSASESFHDKYRSAPATIYQRTMQQESANNLYPPQFMPAASSSSASSAMMSADALPSQATMGEQTAGSSHRQTHGQLAPSNKQVNTAPLPGEIRREGDQYSHQLEQLKTRTIIANHNNEQKLQQRDIKANTLDDSFPRLGLTDNHGAKS